MLGMVFGVLMTMGALLDMTAQTKSVLGDWETTRGSVVRVYGCGEQMVCLRMVRVEAQAPVNDASNPEAKLRGRPLCGLEIGTGFARKSESEADGGQVYDPDSGKTYGGSLRADGDVLKLRGTWGPFWRTEVWKRVTPVAGCAAGLG